MPTYGYKCTQCGFQFQVMQKMSDDPVKICPECAGEVKRLLYPVGIVFKGTGWYINDSRAPEKGENADPKPASTESGSKDAATSEAPAKTSETPAKTETASASTPSPAPTTSETRGETKKE